jgi:hypothetical protein
VGGVAELDYRAAATTATELGGDHATKKKETKVATLEAKIEDSDEAMQRMECSMKDKDDYVAVLELRMETMETMERAISDLELFNHAKTAAG